ncbi:GNAT family N-acetyltransferase [Kitasatospora sp. NBC_00070]|uniref:GNAT family N-acetyltransferase n=1 Tax=Kitasatospora sp. NBC_00070 TaxID=2975962 RepID=UPI00386022E8
MPGHHHVALDHDGRVGWAAVSALSARPRVHGGMAEHSIYVHPTALGQGVARALLEALVDSTEAAGIWTSQSRATARSSAEPDGVRPRADGRTPGSGYRRMPRTERTSSANARITTAGSVAHPVVTRRNCRC